MVINSVLYLFESQVQEFFFLLQTPVTEMGPRAQVCKALYKLCADR